MTASETPLPPRCAWARLSNPLYLAYHDHEWGVPCADETRLFEMLNLEGAQAGLSWETILNKRENYRAAFEGWDAARIAQYGERDAERLLGDSGIVRNRLKIGATVNNAQAALRLREEFGGLVPYLWSWVEGEPVVNVWATSAQVPARTELSDALSKDLTQRGFKFVGSTIVYAYMQAIGMVDDHLTTCFRHENRRGRNTEIR